MILNSRAALLFQITTISFSVIVKWKVLFDFPQMVVTSQTHAITGGQQILYVQQQMGTAVSSPVGQAKPNQLHQPQPVPFQNPNLVQIRPNPVHPGAPVRSEYHEYPPPAYIEDYEASPVYEQLRHEDNYTALKH